MRRKQFGRPQDADIAEQLRSDLVLPSLAAVGLERDRAQALAVRVERKKRIRLVVGMRGRLHERTRDIEFANRKPERHMAAVGRHDRVRHAVLGGNGGEYSDSERKDEEAFHSEKGILRII